MRLIKLSLIARPFCVLGKGKPTRSNGAYVYEMHPTRTNPMLVKIVHPLQLNCWNIVQHNNKAIK
jgi:hypothetical protein